MSLFVSVAFLWVRPRINNGIYIYIYFIFHDLSRLELGWCGDRDLSRLIILAVVKTDTHWDWKFWWMLRPRLIETKKIDRCQEWDSLSGCRDRDHSRLNKRCQDQDFIEVLLISGSVTPSVHDTQGQGMITEQNIHWSTSISAGWAKLCWSNTNILISSTSFWWLGKRIIADQKMSFWTSS